MKKPKGTKPSAKRTTKRKASGNKPAPLPFDGVKAFPRQHMRYTSQIDISALLAAATG